MNTAMSTEKRRKTRISQMKSTITNMEMRKALQGHEESSIFEEITSEDEKGEATLPSVKRAVREAFLKIIEEINVANEY
jgi:hypothetical protein